MDHSPLGRLTSTLRQRIFRFGLVADAEVAVAPLDEAGRSTEQAYKKQIAPSLGWLTSCRALAREAASVLYRDNDFVFAPCPFDHHPPDTDGSKDHDDGGSSRPDEGLYALYDELFEQLTTATTNSATTASIETDWAAPLTHWLTTIGAANRATLHSLTLALGTWDLHGTAPKLEAHVAEQVHLLLLADLSNLTHLFLRLSISIPTPAPTPCAVELRLPLSPRTVEPGLRILAALFGDGFAQLEVLWRLRRITFERFRVLYRDLRRCAERLEGFWAVVVGREEEGGGVSCEGGVDGRDRVMAGALSSGMDDRVIDATRRETTDDVEVEHSIFDGGNGVPPVDEEENGSDSFSSFTGRASSEIRNSLFFSPGGDATNEFLDPHLIRCLTTPRRHQPRRRPTDEPQPSPSTHLTSSSVTGFTILEDWGFAPLSPALYDSSGLSPSPSSGNMPSVIANQLNARWAKRMAYMKKSHEEHLARSRPSSSARGDHSPTISDGTSSVARRSESRSRPAGLQLRKWSSAADTDPGSPTTTAANDHSPALRVRSRTSTSAQTGVSSLDPGPSTPRTPTHPATESGTSTSPVQFQSRSPAASPSKTMQARFAKRANYTQRVLTPGCITQESPRPKHANGLAPSQSEEDLITPAPLKISRFDRSDELAAFGSGLDVRMTPAVKSATAPAAIDDDIADDAARLDGVDARPQTVAATTGKPNDDAVASTTTLRSTLDPPEPTPDNAATDDSTPTRQSTTTKKGTERSASITSSRGGSISRKKPWRLFSSHRSPPSAITDTTLPEKRQPEKEKKEKHEQVQREVASLYFPFGRTGML